MTNHRVERDSMGEVRLPETAYYGPQTQRAVENFPVSGRPLPPELIHALGIVKLAAAVVNRDLGCFECDIFSLHQQQIESLLAACREVANGNLDAHFPVDVFQTGSGTSSNMNANEVIARRANELAGSKCEGEKGEKGQKAGIPPFPQPIHPNDHVNLGQSSNDVFPTAVHLAAALGIRDKLIPALEHCRQTLAAKAEQWRDIIKIGRTHLNDAVPITLGGEVGGMARQLQLSAERAKKAIEALLELPIGGTAVGSGLNTHAEFGRRVCEYLARETGIPFIEAANHFEANAQRDALVECHGQLRTVAVALFAVANNIRWLGCGPRAGFHEVHLPARQPGSSIMPGKVNPVLCESLMQAAARALGNDQTIAFCGAAGGQFQLHAMMPVMADALLETIRLLVNAANAFNDFCLKGMEADAEACRATVEQSLALATALAPLVGYDRAAELAREAHASGKTIRQLCREKNILPAEQLETALDPRRMLGPRD
jgi:fumarate hydratase class II